MKNLDPSIIDNLQLLKSKKSRKLIPGLERISSALRDRRNRRRIQLEVEVRYLDSDGVEQSGQLINISGSGIAVQSSHLPGIDTPIICYLDSLGGYEGVVCRHLKSGFAVKFVSTKTTQEKLVERIMAAANDMFEDIRQVRRHVRVTVEQSAHFEIEDGTQCVCTVIDLSASGVSIKSDYLPEIGTKIKIGQMKGKAVRHIEDGFAVEFSETLSFDRICSRTMTSAMFRSAFDKSSNSKL